MCTVYHGGIKTHEPKNILSEKMRVVKITKILVLAIMSCAIVMYIGLAQNVVSVFKRHVIFHGWNSTRKSTGEQFVAVTDNVSLLTAYGPVSNCSPADVRRRPGVVMLTTANLAFVDVVLNMLASVRRVGVCVNTVIIAEDQMAYDALAKYTKGDPAVHVLKTNSGEMVAVESSRNDHIQYFGIMNKRQAYILSWLERGLEVLFTDSDTFWFRDPFPYFGGNYDMFIRGSPQHYFTNRTHKTIFCAGFIYMKPTVATVQFVGAWVKAMEYYRKFGLLFPDQTVMNDLLQNDQPVPVNIKMLHPDLFPMGPQFFSPEWQKENNSTVVMHAASIRGHALKLQKFKEFGMWLVNVTDLAGDSGSSQEPLLLAFSCCVFLLFVIVLLMTSSQLSKFPRDIPRL